MPRIPKPLLTGRPEREVVAAFRHSLVPMLVADDRRRYVDANAAACLLLRLPLATLRTMRIDDLVGGDPQQVEHLWDAFLQDGIQNGEVTLDLPDGVALAIDYSAVANVLPGRHLSIFVPAGWEPDWWTETPDGLTRQDSGAEPLTRRELEVLELTASGLLAEDIAGQLSISHHTVSTHVRNARLKLGATSRAHAIALALRDGHIRLAWDHAERA